MKKIPVSDNSPCGHTVVAHGGHFVHYPKSGGLSVACDFPFDPKTLAFYDGKQYLRWIPSVWYKPWTWNRNWGQWGL